MLLKKLSYRFLAILLILLISNQLYVFLFYQNDLDAYAPILKEIEKIDDKAQLLYLGSSSNLAHAENDVDKRRISQIISEEMPGNILEDISLYDVTPGVYLKTLKNINASLNFDYIILEMSLRSFGSNEYYSRHANRLNQMEIYLSKYPPLLKKVMLLFKHYYEGNESHRMKKVKNAWKKTIPNSDQLLSHDNAFEWDRAMAIKGVRDKEGGYVQDKTAMACQYIKSFAFKIDEGNPQLKAWDELIKHAKQQSNKVIIHFLSENIEEAELLVGSELTDLMRLNRDFLNERFKKNNVLFFDNLSSVNDADFIDRQWNSERYAEKGRRELAVKIVAGLKQLNLSPTIND